MSRRPVIAFIGSAQIPDDSVLEQCHALGRLAVEAGFRVVTGGLSGVMEAVSRGARSADSWSDGDVIGVIPSYDRSTANEWVDVVIPTGMQRARNVVVVACADVVVAVHGGAGTLSEVAMAWQLDKKVLALSSSGGWAQRMAGERLDHRRDDVVEAFETAEAVIERAGALVLAGDLREPGGIGLPDEL